MGHAQCLGNAPRPQWMGSTGPLYSRATSGRKWFPGSETEQVGSLCSTVFCVSWLLQRMGCFVWCLLTSCARQQTILSISSKQLLFFDRVDPRRNWPVTVIVFFIGAFRQVAIVGTDILVPSRPCLIAVTHLGIGCPLTKYMCTRSSGELSWLGLNHYSDVIMSAMASKISSPTIVYSTVYSGTDQRKHQSSASLAFVRGIHRCDRWIPRTSGQ